MIKIVGDGCAVLKGDILIYERGHPGSGREVLRVFLGWPSGRQS